MATSCCKNVEIVRVKNLSKQCFVDEYLSTGVPVIIEGELDDWPASRWTLDYLLNKVGDNTVNIRGNTDCEDYKLGTKYNIRQSSFKQYVSDLQCGNHRSRNSYLAVQNIKKAFPQITDEAPVPKYVGKVHGGPYLWIARRGHYEYCHFDPDDGLLIMISGRKEVRLYGCDMESMYPNPLGSKGRTIQCSVDCDSPDFDTHPKFKNAVCHHCTLNPGEMLFIPAFWWHQVTSVDMAISINIFFGDAGTDTYLTKVMTQPRWHAFSHWLLNIVEQNRPYDSFERILARLPEALSHFLLKQWHEIASEDQMNTLVQLVLRHCGRDALPDCKSAGKFPPRLQIRGLLWRS